MPSSSHTSIRKRLLIIGVVASALAVSAAVLIFSLAASARSQILEAAKLSTQEVTEALLHVWSMQGEDDHSALRTPDSPRWHKLRTEVLGSIVPVPMVRAGFCGTDGQIYLIVAGGRRRRPLHAGPPPVAEELRKACLNGQSSTFREGNITVVITVKSADAKTRAFALVPVPVGEQGPTTAKIAIILMSIAVLLIVLLLFHTVAIINRDTNKLVSNVSALQTNLGAPLEMPKASELSIIAKSLQMMASHLEEAQRREKETSARLAHEQRLGALGRVVAGVAHEVRNPLAGVKLRLDLMKRDSSLSEETLADVKACLDEVARLDRLVQSLLLVSRGSRENRTSVEIHTLAASRIANLHSLTAAHHITVKLIGKANIITLSDALTQCIDNLLRNAIEASPANADVLVSIANKNESNLELRFIDNGPGIPTERMNELFEPFFTTKSEGTGLGLFLCKSLVESLGGQLHYERNSAQTHFVLTLPQPKSGTSPTALA